MAEARSRAERIADTRALLAQPELDAWVSSWSGDGGGHFVPLSVGWDGTHLILATEPAAVTTRNLQHVPQAWREANEIDGRTLMRDGRWLDG